MNLKEYFRLANLFGKLNSQEKLEDDFTTMPEGETLRFFWESCEQEKIDASSIIERTRMKIQKSEKKRKRNYLLITSASIAASILICISTIYFMNLETVVDLDLQAIVEGLDSQSVDEVTLITAKEQLNLDEDAFIKYSKEGKVAVNSQVIKEEKVKDEQEYNQLIVPSGKRARIELSDGTRLVVNSQSKVVYPRRFKGDIRKIYTQGEVFLEVAHDKKHPFIVETEKYNVRVLGTTFNVSAYPDSDLFETSLIEGKVTVYQPDTQHEVMLQPNEKVETIDGKLCKETFTSDHAFLWRIGVYSFKNEPLEAVFKKLEQYYEVRIINKNIEIASRPCTGKFRQKEGIEHVVKVLQKYVGFDYTLDEENNQIIIY